MNKTIFILTSFLLTLWSGIALCQSEGALNQDEIQVLIDVSGSMKQNDPENLRVEACKLLISILPENSKASILLFAEKATALTESDAVNADWRKQALKSCARIHSRGVYTHIEDAIQTVLNNGFAAKGNKHLILLTDGMVDISRDIMVSADSRERILSEWIPKLQVQNIKVLTIALSDQADKELLNKFAFDTGGWSLITQSAEQLQRAFLKMALKAAPKDGLPLSDNQFNVDKGVKEFSLLAFKKPQSRPSRLVTPEQKKIEKQNAPANVAWLENSSYDLITIKQPGVGDWQLDAEVDSDNQVMIITDLKMQVGELPNFVSEKELVQTKVHFTDHDKLITRADFLRVMTVSVSLDQQAPLNMQPVADETGFFSHTFKELSIGKHSLKILADGKTFKREAVREIEVAAAPVRVEKLITQGKREVTLKLLPDPGLLDISSMAVDISVNRAGKQAETHSIDASAGSWSITLNDLQPGTETTVNFNVMAKALDGKPISPVIQPVKIDDSYFSSNSAPVAPSPELIVQEHKPQESELFVQDARPTLEQNGEKTGPTGAAYWLLVSAIVVGVNLLLLVGGIFIYRAMKKAQAEKQQQLLEKFS